MGQRSFLSCSLLYSCGTSVVFPARAWRTASSPAVFLRGRHKHSRRLAAVALRVHAQRVGELRERRDFPLQRLERAVGFASACPLVPMYMRTKPETRCAWRTFPAPAVATPPIHVALHLLLQRVCGLGCPVILLARMRSARGVQGLRSDSMVAANTSVGTSAIQSGR